MHACQHDGGILLRKVKETEMVGVGEIMNQLVRMKVCSNGPCDARGLPDNETHFRFGTTVK